MKQVWLDQAAEPPANLVFTEVSPEVSLHTYSIYTPLHGEDVFALPLPEFELGMTFSVLVVPTLRWKFIPTDYSFALTVSDERFFGSRRKVFPVKERSFRHIQNSSTVFGGRGISTLNCVFRL